MFREPFAILYAADPESLTKFYVQIFGFRQAYRWPARGRLEYAYLTMGSRGVGIALRAAVERLQKRPLSDRMGVSAELCFYVEDPDRAEEFLRSKGVQQLTQPADQPWGERVVYFVDPEGNAIHITARTPATVERQTP